MFTRSIYTPETSGVFLKFTDLLFSCLDTSALLKLDSPVNTICVKRTRAIEMTAVFAFEESKSAKKIIVSLSREFASQIGRVFGRMDRSEYMV